MKETGCQNSPCYCSHRCPADGKVHPLRSSSSLMPSSSSSSFTIWSTAGYKSQTEVEITAGTRVYHLPVEEGRRASEREERFSSIHRQIKIHLDPLKGGGRWWWWWGGSFWHQCVAIDCASHYQYMIQSKKGEEERRRERAFLLPCHQIRKTSPL